MRPFERTVSLRFLMSLPSNIFLRAAYALILEREIDEEGLRSFNAFDYDQPANREQMIIGLMSSEEYKQLPAKTLLTGPETLPSLMRALQPQGLHWDNRIAVAREWYELGENTLSLPQRYVPLALWIGDRACFYQVAGMKLAGDMRDNVLTAPPEWVAWGPKTPIKQGRYTIKINIEAAPSALFFVDVAAEGGTIVFKKIEYFGTINMVLPLEIDRDYGEFEVRLFNLTGHSVECKINEISISPRL